jgi:putative transcriptional regulator
VGELSSRSGFCGREGVGVLLPCIELSHFAGRAKDEDWAAAGAPTLAAKNSLYANHKKIVDIHKLRCYTHPRVIDVKLDLMLVKRKMTLTQLSQRVQVSITNLSLLKTGRVKAIRFSTLEAICRELDCQPGDLLEYSADSV